MKFSDLSIRSGGDMTYRQDRDGKWWKLQLPYRCLHQVPFGALGGQCQGAYGHDGEHWLFSPDGSYLFHREGHFSGQTPPGHQRYKTPIEMQSLCYKNQRSEWEEVKDVAEIARLRIERAFG